MLLEEHPAKLRERVCPHVVERPEDALAVIDGECDDLAIECERLLKKGTRRLIHQPDSSRTSSSGIRRPAEYTGPNIPREWT